MDFKLGFTLWIILLFIGVSIIYGLIEYLENRRK